MPAFSLKELAYTEGIKITGINFDMLSQSEQQRMYEKGGNSPRCWEQSADQLIAAATVLKDQRQECDTYIQNYPVKKVNEELLDERWKLLPPELMLRGYAIECLLKSAWIKADNLIVIEGKYQGIPDVGDHNLIQLAQKVNIPLDEKSKDMLKRLTCYINFAGRYPVSKGLREGQIQKSSCGKGQPTFWISPTDYDTFDNFLRVIRDKL